jgi:hypothetical protein
MKIYECSQKHKLSCTFLFQQNQSLQTLIRTGFYNICGMSVFVDNHYNKYSQLKSQTIREAGRACWMPGEALLVSAGRLRNCWPLKGPFVFQLANWLAVEPLALKRGVHVAVNWLAGCIMAGRGGCSPLIFWYFGVPQYPTRRHYL